MIIDAEVVSEALSGGEQRAFQYVEQGLQGGTDHLFVKTLLVAEVVAHHSRCSVIHPVGDHNHRSYFLQNQKPVIRMERSTDFFRFKAASISR
ncbi:MAG: hypothetical protein P8179_23130 [Candidatus Thiodiazotropha sp.]